jgi:hypothetical protein
VTPKSRKAGAQPAPPADAVFREFAWIIAGTLARKPAVKPQVKRTASK